MDSWFLAAVKNSAGSEKMVAEDPLRKICLGKLRNIPTQLTCILLVLIQSLLINFHMAKAQSQLHWMWFIGDAVIVVFFIVSFYLREWRIKPVAERHKSAYGFQKGLPFAPLSWFVYAAALSARVCIIFTYDLQYSQEIGDLKISICVTAVICIFFTWGHHHNHESLARRASILSLVKTFTIDLLDTVDLLDVLFLTAQAHEDTVPKALKVVTLSVVTLNFIRPSIVISSLFVDHHGSHSRALKVKILKALFELLMLNVPLLIVRSYLAATYSDPISVFLVKNILGILFGLTEIYDCCYEINMEKSLKTGTRNSSNASDKSEESQLTSTPNGNTADTLNKQTELTI